MIDNPNKNVACGDKPTDNYPSLDSKEHVSIYSISLMHWFYVLQLYSFDSLTCQLRFQAAKISDKPTTCSSPHGRQIKMYFHTDKKFNIIWYITVVHDWSAICFIYLPQWRIQYDCQFQPNLCSLLQRRINTFQQINFECFMGELIYLSTRLKRQQSVGSLCTVCECLCATPVREGQSICCNTVKLKAEYFHILSEGQTK